MARIQRHEGELLPPRKAGWRQIRKSRLRPRSAVLICQHYGGPPMAWLRELTEDAAISPFSAKGFAERARLRGLALEKAWRMAEQLVPVLVREPEVTVLLTLRTSHLKAHGGQIAFPGGKIEAEDATPVGTAIREAEEEAGIPPALVTPLSLLDLHNTGTGFRIIPVLSLVDPGFEPVPHPGEVAEVFEVPLSYLMTEENHMRHLREWKGSAVQFYAIEYEKRFIWGATAAILRNLYERLYAPDAESQ